MGDRIIKAITRDASIKISVANTADMVNRAAKIHGTSSVATDALGRALTAVSIMGSDVKFEHGSTTLQIKGDGPLGSIICVSDSMGNTRGYLQNPSACIERGDDKGISKAIGRGKLIVIKDLGLKQPFNGITDLISGEIAEDLTSYFYISDQIPSVVSLGVMVDVDLSVKYAGGFIVQAMPGVIDEDLLKLENNIKGIKPMTAMLDSGLSLEQIASEVLKGFDLDFLESIDVKYKCNCSEKRVTTALISLGREELERLISEEEVIEVTCQFCDIEYSFKKEDMEALLADAIRKK